MATPNKSLFEQLSPSSRRAAENAAGVAGSTDPCPNSSTVSACESLVTVDMANSRVRHEMALLICGWLDENGFRSSLQALREEAGLLRRDEYNRRKQTKAAVKAVEEGNWDAVNSGINKFSTSAAAAANSNSSAGGSGGTNTGGNGSGSNGSGGVSAGAVVGNSEAFAGQRNYKNLVYLSARQQFLELVEGGDSQKGAFSLFLRKIKPLEAQIPPAEFQALLYLLTVKSVSEGVHLYAPFAQWTVESGRRHLCQQLRLATGHSSDSDLDAEVYLHHHGVKPLGGQLTSLIHQGFSYQVLCSFGSVQLPEPLKLLRTQQHTVAGGGGASQFSATPPEALLQITSVTRHAFEHMPPIQPVIQFQTGLRLKAIDIVPELGVLVTGASDGSVHLWVVDPSTSDSSSPSSLTTTSMLLGKHAGRVWALSATPRRRSSSSSSTGGVEVPSSSPGQGGQFSVASPPAATAGAGQIFMASSVGADGNLLIFDISAASTLLWQNHLKNCDIQAKERESQKSAAATAGDVEDQRVKKTSTDKPQAQHHTIKGGAAYLLATLSRHTGDAFCVDVASDGNCVGTGGVKGEVILWSASSKLVLFERTYGSSAISSVKFSKYGGTLYVGAKDGVIRVIDVATGFLTQSLQPPLQAEVTGISLAPTACYLAASYKNNTNRIWDLMRGEPLPARLHGNRNTSKNFVRCAFSATQDSHLFVGSEDGKIVMWEVQRGESVNTTAQGITSNNGQVAMVATNSATLAAASSLGSTVSAVASPPPLLSAGSESAKESLKHEFVFHRSMVTDLKTSAQGAGGVGVMVSCSEEGKIVVCSSRVEPLFSRSQQ